MTATQRTMQALLLAAAIAVPGAAWAHGANPAVLDGGVRGDDGAPWLVRLSRGLGRATADGSWEYLCPQQFRADETVFVAPLGTKDALVLGLSAAYVVPDAGPPMFVADLPFPASALRSLTPAEPGEALALVADEAGAALWRFSPEPALEATLDQPWRVLFFDGDEVWLARVDGTTLRWRSRDGSQAGSVEIDDASAGSGLAIRVLPDGWYAGVQVDDGVRIGRISPGGSGPADAAWYGALSPAFGGPAWHEGEPLWLDDDVLYRRGGGTLVEAGSTSFVELGGGLGTPAWGVSVRRLATLDGTPAAQADETLFDLVELQQWPIPEDASELTQQQCYLDAVDVAFHAGLPTPGSDGSGGGSGDGSGAEARDGEGGGCAAAPTPRGGPFALLALGALALRRRRA